MIVGLAGGTAARQLHAAYPGIMVDGVEIDQQDRRCRAEVLRPDRRHRERRRWQTAVRARDLNTDLRSGLSGCVPAALCAISSGDGRVFPALAKHLNPGGVVVVNAGRTKTDFRLVDALSATLPKAYPTVLVVDVARYRQQHDLCDDEAVVRDQFAQRLRETTGIPLVQTVSGWALENGNIRTASTSGMVFTDDKAPVEWIIDQIIFDEAVREEQ